MTSKAAQPTAGAALGQLMKLVEDGILVRNTKDDGDVRKYLTQSSRLVLALKEANTALESLTEMDRQHEANRELLEALKELSSAIRDGLRRHAAGDPNAIASNMISATLHQSEAAIAKARKP